MSLDSDHATLAAAAAILAVDDALPRVRWRRRLAAVGAAMRRHPQPILVAAAAVVTAFLAGIIVGRGDGLSAPPASILALALGTLTAFAAGVLVGREAAGTAATAARAQTGGICDLEGGGL